MPPECFGQVKHCFFNLLLYVNQFPSKFRYQSKNERRPQILNSNSENNRNSFIMNKKITKGIDINLIPYMQKVVEDVLNFVLSRIQGMFEVQF